MNLEFIGKCLLIETEGRRILVVGDLHLGYEEYLNRTGVFVGREMFKEVLNYFESVFAETGNVDEVVFLGDVKHDFGKMMRQEVNDVEELFSYILQKCRRIVVVRGNHDAILEPILRVIENTELRESYCVGEVCFFHGNKKSEEVENKKIKFWIMGHGHPAVKLSEPGGVKREKFKCFLKGRFKGREVLIVPSFFEGNEGSDPRENDLGFAFDFNLNKFEVLIVGENLEVFEFGPLSRL
ncbi:metallophosphoesterase [Candidatus Pacearchaeota archaeon]|nr:metallophosphoesterase [Candidatus Pacearchaeota archaeon]